MQNKKSKIISVIVIIGMMLVTFSSTSAVNLNNNSVEIPIQIFTPDGYESYSMKVSRIKSDKLDRYIDSIQQELNEAKSHEEVITIFDNAIIKLDEIGIIPKEININELQTQITENIQFSYRINYEFTETYLNNNCLIVGRSDDTFGEYHLSLLFPGWIAFGWWYNLWNENLPADGWIYTSGENGNWYYDGTFYGTLGMEMDPFFNELYVGARGFRGIILGDSRSFYIGFAERVGIEA